MQSVTRVFWSPPPPPGVSHRLAGERVLQGLGHLRLSFVCLRLCFFFSTFPNPCCSMSFSINPRLLKSLSRGEQMVRNEMRFNAVLHSAQSSDSFSLMNGFKTKNGVLALFSPNQNPTELKIRLIQPGLVLIAQARPRPGPGHSPHSVQVQK